MYIERISLLDFRNLKAVDVSLNDGINIFCGNNAQGKTNFLEAVYICATGRSQRTRLDNQLIEFNSKEAHIQTSLISNRRKDRIDVHLRKEGKKGIAVNGIPVKKLGELFGILHVVIFSPEDLQLIKGGPAERRKFIDLELCQLSKVYYYNLQQYYKVLKHRNNLLKDIKKSDSLKNTLSVWDDQLFVYGLKIIDERKAFIEKLSELANSFQNGITNNEENLKIEYKPNVDVNNYKNKFNSYLNRDMMIGTTHIGPHKDDIVFYVNGYDVKIFGSQGQQRTAALSSKLAEIELIKSETGNSPVLLLDDVLSELDENRQKYLFESINGIQTIITCTGIEDSLKKIIHESYLYSVKNGEIVNEINTEN